MKKLFYFGILLLILFEISAVYFIMPMPGSQEMNSIDIAYFLYSWRWFFRIVFLLMIAAGFQKSFKASRFFSILVLLIACAITYMTNFKMAADVMFYQPETLSLKNTKTNSIDGDRLVIGITYKGASKAYPVQFLGYHHQVRDTIGDKPVMVTYCTVCRTGRVFEPIVNGKTEIFRLVGMDHFNAMFEDETTKSWWRQATGEAITGSSKGQYLPEFPSVQMTLDNWILLHPETEIMQPDKKFLAEYQGMSKYEKGTKKGSLTRRDFDSWKPKSWVVGVCVGKQSKAYDWNKLLKEQVIYDVVDNTPIAVILSKDKSSFSVLERANNKQKFTLQNDTLVNNDVRYNFIGISLTKGKPSLKKVAAYQEYWHSWKTFHPLSEKDI